MHIAWNLLGLVFVVSFAAAVAVIVLFALGVAAIAPDTEDISSRTTEFSLGIRYTVAAACFTAAGLIIAYGVYIIVAK